MPEGYWGDKVDPEEDDFDLWINPARGNAEDEDEEDEEDDPELEEAFATLDSLIDDLGPAAVLETIAQFLFDLPRPYHRIAKQVHALGDRVRRTVGAIEEARQTRGK